MFNIAKIVCIYSILLSVQHPPVPTSFFNTRNGWIVSVVALDKMTNNHSKLTSVYNQISC